MQSILQSKYYNIGKEKVGKYLVQTRSQARSSGIHLPEAHGIGKGLGLNVLPEKQVTKPIITSEVKGMSEIKPGIHQGRAVLRRKIKTLRSPPINKPIVKVSEKPIEQPKVTSKIPIPESSSIHDEIIPIPDHAIPQTRSGDDSSFRMVKIKNHTGYQ